MNEPERLAWSDPDQLLVVAQQRRPSSERKLRLFAAGAARTVWGQLWYRQGRESIEVAERYADGLCDLPALLRAGRLAGNVVRRSGYQDIYRVARDAALADAHKSAVFVLCRLRRVFQGDAAYLLRLSHLLRDIVGNPFRPTLPLPPAVLAWNDGTLKRIAEGVYDDPRLPEGTLDTSRLAVLADALLDAGCGDEELLEHLHSSGPHWRGCWGVGLLLGKS